MRAKIGFTSRLLTAVGLLFLASLSYAQYNPLSDGQFPYCPDVNGQHLNWNGWLPGGGPVCGTSTGAAAPPAISAPATRSVSLATAYQATDTTKPAIITVNLNSSATLTLSGGTTNTADVLIGATSGVASGTGSIVGRYRNLLSGTLVVGVSIANDSTSTYTFILPAGWYFAVRQTAGTVSVTSTFDQSVG